MQDELIALHEEGFQLLDRLFTTISPTITMMMIKDTDKSAINLHLDITPSPT